MNKVIQIEDRVSRSRSKHEGESSADICDRLSRTRVSSQRQLPTDHDYAVSTRGYQIDQSSPLPATAAADLVPDAIRQKLPQRFADVDRVTPYQCLYRRLSVLYPTVKYGWPVIHPEPEIGTSACRAYARFQQV